MEAVLNRNSLTPHAPAPKQQDNSRCHVSRETSSFVPSKNRAAPGAARAPGASRRRTRASRRRTRGVPETDRAPVFLYWPWGPPHELYGPRVTSGRATGSSPHDSGTEARSEDGTDALPGGLQFPALPLVKGPRLPCLLSYALPCWRRGMGCRTRAPARMTDDKGPARRYRGPAGLHLVENLPATGEGERLVPPPAPQLPRPER